MFPDIGSSKTDLFGPASLITHGASVLDLALFVLTLMLSVHMGSKEKMVKFRE